MKLSNRIRSFLGLDKRKALKCDMPNITPAYLDSLGVGSGLSSSGANVTVPTALTTAPFWGGVNILSGDVSQIPFITYRRRGDGGKDRAIDHPTFKLLRSYTGEITSNLWLAIMTNQAICYGTSYSRIYRGGPGYRPTKLVNLPPGSVRPVRKGGVIAYEVTYWPSCTEGTEAEVGGQVETLKESDVFRVPGLMFDVCNGLSVVEYARHTIGRLISAGTYADDFYRNSGSPDGFFVEGGVTEMSDDAKENFLRSIENRHSGAGNRFKYGLLEEGITFQPIGVAPKDALMIEAMDLGRKDVSLFLNLPAHKLGDDTKESYGSLEQENQSYLDSGLGVWLSRFEFEAHHKLFREDEKSEYFCEFLRDAKLRADTKTRFEVYSIARAAEIMSANECRILENMNPYDGGDEYINPNIKSGVADNDDETDSEASNEDEQTDSDVDSEDNTRSLFAHRDLLVMQLTRATNRLHYQARSAAKEPARFLNWLNRLEDENESYLRDMLGPVTAVLEHVIDKDESELLRKLVAWCFEEVRASMLTAAECDPDKLVDRVVDTESNTVVAARRKADDLILGELKHDKTDE